MLGQDHLIKYLNSCTIDSFPKASLLLGPFGCGKHTYLDMISNKLNLNKLDVTDVIDFEYILNMYNVSIPNIYFIDIDKFTEKKQNIILKLLEEPPSKAYIVLLATDKSLLLPTIINRCNIFEFKPYTKEVLCTFIKDNINTDLICNVLDTPGKVLTANSENITDLYNLCVKICMKLPEASFNNALTISDKMNYSDQYNKFDIEAFFMMMKKVLLEKYIETSSLKLLDYYSMTIEYTKRLHQDKRLDKQKLIENYIGKMWVLG